MDQAQQITRRAEKIQTKTGKQGAPSLQVLETDLANSKPRHSETQRLLFAVKFLRQHSATQPRNRSPVRVKIGLCTQAEKGQNNFHSPDM